MKATLSSDTRQLSLVGQAETGLQQLPQADNLEALQRRINRRVLHDLFKAHPQLQVTRTSSQAFSILLVTAADDKHEIDTSELVRQLQQWHPEEVSLAQATPCEMMPRETIKPGKLSIQIDIGGADPRLFFARLRLCANQLDPSGASLLVSDFPQSDFIDFLYYQVSRRMHDDFLEQLPGFESLVTSA